MDNFKKDVRAIQQEIRDSVCKGIYSHEDYKEMCGKIRGIDIVLELYDVAMKEAMEAE